ncbi:MAG: hypothetical protein NVV74_05875 [Magnetospirillum sp.]|nr:hypothetical protein [Magnetospirillum sp.]
MELPADQRLLHDDLCAKLEQQQDKAQLIAFMGGVLGSLLRRRGDAAFLHAVQDAFTAGLAGRAWPQQVELAREVIGTVIAKRPEIALAWQRVSGEQPHPLARRAVDLSPDDLPEISVTPEEEAPPPVDSFAAFEAAVVDDVAGALGRRLALFALPPQRFPSPTYVHEQPFFLATEAFAQVARKFLAGVLLPLWRDQLHQLHARQGGLDPVTAVTQARTELWTLVAERLGNLAALSDSAQAKLAAARSGADDQPEFHLIEVPVSRKRVFSVLGVNFTLGSSTEMVTRKVAVEGPGKPTPDEMLALDLATRWHDMAAAAGLDLPPVADLAALQAVLTFDAGRLAEDMPGLLALARDPDVEHEALLDGIEAAVAGHPPAVADAVAVALFAHGVDGGFGYEEPGAPGRALGRRRPSPAGRRNRPAPARPGLPGA